MTDYYTTTSLATAAAAIEQGFEGCETVYDYLDTEDGVPVPYPVHQFVAEHSGSNDYEINSWRFPKTPHNVGLMIPLVGDLLSDGKLAGYFEKFTLVESLDEDNDEYYEAPSVRMYDTTWALHYEDYRIVERNNKPFPIWDKE
jgi:hypothetical protein